MKTGVILNHKYFNGVMPEDISRKYKSETLKYFNNFGMEGTGMFAMIAKGPNIESDYNWENTDLLIEHANHNGAQIHFNTVITGHIDIFPQWYKDLDPEQKLKVLENHVKAVVGRYKGKVNFFKLVNEAVREPDEKYLGTNLNKAELIADIFKWAVETYQEGRYMFNEFGCLIRDEIREPFLKLVDDVTKLGGRIDVIGEQAHSGYHPRPFFLPPDEQLNKALDGIHTRTRLPMMITEFDMSPKNGNYEGGSIDPNKPVTCDGITYSTWFDYQSYAYNHMRELCGSKDYIEEFYYWGIIDDPTITWERENTGLFDENIEPKKNMIRLLLSLEKREGKY
ncbi:endo-1,4-beta-xylanase [Candidatus Dojkabacteria bacterium]|nr:endo-1,4-beta-xylanase [Candidatus Dojkabacteria bacterium]